MAGVVYNIVVFSFLIVLQTFVFNSYGFYDFLLVWIIFYYTDEKVKSRVLTLCLIAGYFKDSLSGGVFGVYISSYLWFFLLIHITSGFFNINNYAFIQLFGFCGIAIEAFFIFLSNYIWYFSKSLLDDCYNKLLLELIWCFVSFLLCYFTLLLLKKWIKEVGWKVKNKMNKLSRI